MCVYVKTFLVLCVYVFLYVYSGVYVYMSECIHVFTCLQVRREREGDKSLEGKLIA